MASINDGAEGLNKSVSEAVRSAEQGVLTATKFQKIIQDAKGDYSAIVTSIIAADKEMKKGAATWTTVGNIAKQIGEESAEWVTHYKNAAGGVKGMSIAMKKLAESAGDAADKQQTHEDSVKNVMMLLKASVGQSSRYGVQLKAIEKQEKEILATMSAHGESAKKLQEAKSELAEIDKKIRDLGADQTAEGQKTLDVLAKQRDATAGLVAEQSQSVVMADEQKKAFYEQLNALEKQREEVKELAKNAEEYKNSMTGAASSAMGLFKGMLKASPKELRDKQSKFKAISEDAKTMGAGKGAVGKAAAGALGGLADMGGAISGLLMKLNLPMMIAQAVIAAFDMAIDFIYKNDAIVKKFNNVFQEVTAPVTDGKAFVKGAKTFSDTINKASGAAGQTLNYELGTTADEWSGMFKSMTSKGQNIQALTGNLGDMVPVMRAVKGSSLVMGKSLDEMGSDMAEWSAAFKSPFDSMEKSMDKMGFSAKRAGLTGKFFLDTVNQSVLALSSYGKFITVASDALTKFSKSGLTSQKDAAAASQQYVELLSGDFQKNMEILGLAEGGGRGPSKKELWSKSLEGRKEDLKGTTEGSAEWKKLTGEIAVMEDVMRLAPGKQDAAIAKSAKYMSDQTGAVLEGYIKQFTNNNKDSVADISYLLDKLPAELVQTISSQQAYTTKSLMDMTKEMTDPNNPQSKLAKKSIMAFLKDTKTSAAIAENSDKSIGGLMLSIDALTGVSAGTKEGLKDLLNDPESFKKIMEKGGDLSKMTASELNDLALHAATSVGGDTKKTAKITGQKDQIDATTELSKRMGITKDTAKYIMSSSDLMKSSVGFLGGILKGINRLIDMFAKLAIYMGDTPEEMDLKEKEKERSDAKEVILEANKKEGKNVSDDDVEKQLDDMYGATRKRGVTEGLVRETANTAMSASGIGLLIKKPIDKLMDWMYGGDSPAADPGTKEDGTPTGQAATDAYYGSSAPKKNAGGGIAAGVSGVVPGTAISGDSIPTNMLNSKEMILNTAQQANLFRMLDFGSAAPPSSGQSGGGQEAVRVANVTVNVSGVSGDDVVKAIQKYWANAKFWDGTKPGYGTPV